MKRFLKRIERFGKQLLLKIVTFFMPATGKIIRLPGAGEVTSLLIIRIDGKMGNLILTLPLIQVLRKQFPGAHVTVLAASGQSSLLLHNPHIDTILPFSAGALLLNPFKAVKLFRMISNPDLVVECSNPGSFSVSHAILLALIGGRYRMGFDRGESSKFLNVPVPLNEEQHYRDIMLDLARFLTPGIQTEGPYVFLTGDECNEARQVVASLFKNGVSPLIGIWPGARHGKKWPLPKYIELVDRLTAGTGAGALFLFGPEETGMYDGFRNRINQKAYSVTDVRKLAALLHGCDVVICGDTGPLHLSTALERPTIGLFNFANMDIYGYDNGRQFRSVFLPGHKDPTGIIVKNVQEILKLTVSGADG